MQSVPKDSSKGAVRREWPSPFARTATPDWIFWDAPLGRVGTEHPVDARSPRSGRLLLVASAQERVGTEHPVDARSPRSERLILAASALERAGKWSFAVLRFWARAKAIPGEARLALNRFPTRCNRNYYLDRVLVPLLEVFTVFNGPLSLVKTWCT